MSCFSCASQKEADDTPYRPHPKTRPDQVPLQQQYAQEQNQAIAVVTNSKNHQAEEMQPLTHTEVKTIKSGNTVTVVRTTHTRIVNTTQRPAVVIEEGDLEPGYHERVYQTTVVKTPQTTKSRRFNLKSVLVRNPKKTITTTAKEEGSYQERCLEAHNQYRARHGLKPLVLNENLCKYATEWAQHLAKKNKLQHRKKNKFGENLALGTGSTYTVNDAVTSWYNEIEHYDFQKPGFSPQTGHFSQVVWEETTQLGVGVAEKDNRTWIVCNYDPPGNVIGQYKDNVVAPKGKQSKWKVREPVDNAKLEASPDDSKPSTSQAFKKVESNKNQKWSKFELECLEAHNQLRAQHKCSPLTLNRSLCNLANDWATHLAKIRTMYHRPQNEYGENIYQIVNREPSGEEVVKCWYDEIRNYKFKKPGFSSGTGHFTQVVWADSKELGVGKAKVDNTTFVVCNYNPAGNVIGYYKNQVPPIGGFKDDANRKGKVNVDVTDSSTINANGLTPVLKKKSSNIFTTNWFKSKQAK